MTVGEWLPVATRFLQSKGIFTARLDCMVLLEDVLQTPRAKLLAEPDTNVHATQVDILQKLLARRAKHEPLAYIRGRSEFYGREFRVSRAVLEPRPESETIIDLLKALPLPDGETLIADVGTGSGALGITASRELAQARVDLIDVDPYCLKVAQTNVDFLTTRCRVVQADLLNGAADYYDVLLCNLPYVPDGYPINKAAEHEPALALFGGSDGLDLYRKLFAQLQDWTRKPLYILCESLPESHAALEALAAQHGYTLTKTDDFVQLFVPTL